jgi:hypothetical protein
MMIRSERDGLLEARKEMRRQADSQKQHIVDTFEKMKMKGKIDVRYIY